MTVSCSSIATTLRPVREPMPVFESGCPAREGGTRTSNSLTPSPNITVASPLTSDMMLSTPSEV